MPSTLSIPPRALVNAVRRESVKQTTLIALGDAVKGRLGLAKMPGAMRQQLPPLRAALQYANARIDTPSITQRLTQHKERKYRAEAARRGLETILNLHRNGTLLLTCADQGKTSDGYPIMLLYASGYAQYSRRVGYYRSLSVLAGEDDGGLWAVRVPGTLQRVAQALEWLTPAAVRKAEESGKRVLHQGDVFLVEARVDDFRDLPSSHFWTPTTRTLTHGAHNALHIPFAARAIRQTTIAANGIGRRYGD